MLAAVAFFSGQQQAIHPNTYAHVEEFRETGDGMDYGKTVIWGGAQNQMGSLWGSHQKWETSKETSD